MKELNETIASILFFVVWLAGIALAKGIGVFFAAIFPPYAWYLVIERAMLALGWLT